MFLTGNHFGCDVTFVYPFVCQHWLTHDVTDRINVRNVGAHLLVGTDKATLIHFNASQTGIQLLTVRHTTDGYQHGVITLRFGRRFLAFHADVDPVFTGFHRSHLGFQHQVKLLADLLGEHFHDVFIGSRDHLIEHLDHVNL